MLEPVCQTGTERGNFFLEPLAKTGAGQKYQLFGQIGLDHGPEWYHGKFTGIAQSFTTPTYIRSVYIAGGSVDTTVTNTTTNLVNTQEVTGT